MADSLHNGNTVVRFFGGLLMTVGVLIGGLGGLCTLGFIGLFVVSAASTRGYPGEFTNALGSTVLSLFIGAFPMGIGAALFLAGRSLRRSAGPRKS